MVGVGHVRTSLPSYSVLAGVLADGDADYDRYLRDSPERTALIAGRAFVTPSMVGSKRWLPLAATDRSELGTPGGIVLDRLVARWTIATINSIRLGFGPPSNLDALFTFTTARGRFSTITD